MKCLFRLIAIIVAANILPAHAQPTLAQASSKSLPADTAYAVSKRDANADVWERTTYETDPSGKAVPQKHSYTELATGLNHLVNGQWVESKAEIDVLPDGTAAATNGQHQVYFPSDIYQGQIEMVTPAGQHLKSRPMGLSYDDGRNTVLIAQLTNSVGYLVGSNQVIYPDVFTGFKADLRYTYTKAGFEQDVILREQPPTPASFKLNPDTTRLQVLTEFFDPPQPTVKAGSMRTDAGEVEDDQLDFDGMQMARGKAFLLGTNAATATVTKHWVKMEGRQFLVEEVPTATVASELENLPLPSALNAASPQASRHLSLPPLRLAQKIHGPQPLQLATADFGRQKGYVLDYQTLNSSVTNYTFQGDVTYYISDALTLNGANVLEGGTVIKSADSICFDTTSTTLTCLTASYRPAVFTSPNDNSVGETISGSSGSPSNNGVVGLWFTGPNGMALQNIRMSYFGVAIYLDNYPSDINANVIRDAQFVNCGEAVRNAYDYCKLLNGLIVNGGYGFDGGTTIWCENVTFDRLVNFDDHNNPLLCLTNCLVTAVTNTYGTINGAGNQFPASDSGVFQAVGAGSYYLATNSPYRNAGTTNINPALLADLRNKTTYPPLVYSNVTISVATTFSSQVQRDTDVPDLGYHYDPLDYVFGGVNVRSNLTFTAGIAVGWFELPSSYGNGYGISITNGMNVNFNGTATMPCTFTRYGTVQEGGNGLWTDKSYPGGIVNQTAYTETNFPTLRATFTRFGHLAAEPGDFRDGSSGQPLVVQATHCEIWGSFGGYNILGAFTNCLLDRVGFWQGTSSTYLYEIFRNCTFHGGTFDVVHWEGGAPYWYTSVRNCAFDGTSISVDDPFGANTAYEDYDYNSFLSGGDQLPHEGIHTWTPVSYNWQSSWLGNFYLPYGSSLVDAGSTTADQVGLYHFTTQTNQVPETNSIVDIGYHYVATDAYGNLPPPVTESSEGTNFWLGFGYIADPWPYFGDISVYITSPVGASGMVTLPGFGITNTFTVAAGGVTNIDLTNALSWFASFDIIVSGGVHVMASAPVSVYGVCYSEKLSTAFTAYPTSLLGTNYCVMARELTIPDSDGLHFSEFQAVATEDGTTTVTITPSATADLGGNGETNAYTETLQQGQTYQIAGVYNLDDVTGTRVTSDKPIALFAGVSLANVPDANTFDVNPLMQQQLPVESWGTQVLALSFAGRLNGDDYRILAAYSNTVVTINGKVITITNEPDDGITPWGITATNETMTTNLAAGGFCDIIVDGPVEFQATQPIQVAQFANGTSSDDVTNAAGQPHEGDPCEIILPPTGHYLLTNTVVTLTNNFPGYFVPYDDGDGPPITYPTNVPDYLIGDFDENYLNLIVAQSAITNTLVDGSHIATTNFVPIGTSGYYGAQVTITNSGAHTVTSSQPVGVEVYGFGFHDAYGYFGGIVK